MPSKFLIIGIGNRDRGDDSVGPKLAEKLAKDAALRAMNVDILSHSGEGASLMELWQGTEKTVIVDAMKSKAPLGRIVRLEATKEKLAAGAFYYSSHLFSLAEAVELARSLDRLPKELIIYGIEGSNFAFGAPLSKPVAAAMKKVETAIRKEFTKDTQRHSGKFSLRRIATKEN
jgi:hydrogenase maturation protease